MEDFRVVTDYLVTLDYVDDQRIGVLGICGGGGYAINASMTERRIKAVATITGANYGRVMREGVLANGDPVAFRRILPGSVPQRRAARRCAWT